jgi:hypothetical protein
MRRAASVILKVSAIAETHSRYRDPPLKVLDLDKGSTLTKELRVWSNANPVIEIYRQRNLIGGNRQSLLN